LITAEEYVSGTSVRYIGNYFVELVLPAPAINSLLDGYSLVRSDSLQVLEPSDACPSQRLTSSSPRRRPIATICFDLAHIVGGVDGPSMYDDSLGSLRDRLRRLPADLSFPT
jgi:hypothetical protein